LHASSKGHSPQDASENIAVSNKIFTIPNFISFIRLCLVPVFFVLLYEGFDLLATLVFAIAACTDWIDGQIARRTNTVTRLGQLLDPAVDRILVFSGVLGLLLIGRIPMWIVVFILLRDGLLLLGGAGLLRRYKIRIPVIFAGKAATAALLFGFVGLLLNWPLIPGLGICDFAWLPGFNAVDVSWGIWFVYLGLVLSFSTWVYYLYTAYKKVREHKESADRPST
jgi:cardiolipin synthase